MQFIAKYGGNENMASIANRGEGILSIFTLFYFPEFAAKEKLEIVRGAVLPPIGSEDPSGTERPFRISQWAFLALQSAQDEMPKALRNELHSD